MPASPSGYAPLPPPPDLFPFEGGDWRLTMGLMALDPANWILIDATAPAQLAERRRLTAALGARVATAVPEAGPPLAELLEHLSGHLVRRFPNFYRQSGGEMEVRLTGDRVDLDGDPLTVLAHLVPEDLLLLAAEGEGHRLLGGTLCFPNRWRLLDKVGKVLPAVHGPVPDYARRLAGPVDRFIAALKPDKPVWRMNWGLGPDPDLYLPDEMGDLSPDLTGETAGERLFLRIERQTLLRLPDTGAVVFGIRTYVRTLAEAAGRPERAAAMARALRTIPAEMSRYKGTDRLNEVALAWLDRRAGAPRPPPRPRQPMIGTTRPDRDC